MEIKDINPWWKTKQIESEFRLPQRELFQEIVKYLPERQILVLTGLRRTGKTVLMHHLIEFLLQETPPEQIFYYNFDLGEEKLETLLKKYQEISGKDGKTEKIFVFLDEIQKQENWENELKLLYDFTKIKFIISGSSSLFIEKKSKESLAGRTFSFQLAPLTFREYLQLKGQSQPPEKWELFSAELKSSFNHYLRTGGFPELLSTTEEVKIDKYIKELILDRIVYIDIPQVFEIEEPALLVKLLAIISANPGMLTDYDGLANDLNRNRKTISNYLFYLEQSFLVKKLYNYSRNLLTSEKKVKKLYPSSTAFAFLYEAEKGRMMETAFLMNRNALFFSRKGNKEVDFILTEGDTLLPIELKYVSKKPQEKELKGILSFMNTETLTKGMVLLEEGESVEEFEGKSIYFLPLWRWLLEKSFSSITSI